MNGNPFNLVSAVQNIKNPMNLLQQNNPIIQQISSRYGGKTPQEIAYLRAGEMGIDPQQVQQAMNMIRR